jgi:G3E family GTPase
MTDPRVPVTILTGFLGAGKTTLLNRILSENHGMRIAVIENEFGEIGIDHELVIGTEEELFEMNNGCICCTVRGDLIRILGLLMKRRNTFDHIVIETTGLADPGPVVQTFFVDDEMREKLRINGVVTVVDAAHIAQSLSHSHEAAEQIAFADVVVLNKCDLAGADVLDDLEAKLRGMNAMARLVRAERAQVDIPAIMDIGGFQLDRILAIEPDFLDEGAHDHEHDSHVTSVGLTHDGDCDGAKLNDWLPTLLRDEGADIFRTKGVFAVKGNPDRVVLQGVHMLLDAAKGAAWGGAPRRSQLVFIGRDLDRDKLTTGFRGCCL